MLVASSSPWPTRATQAGIYVGDASPVGARITEAPVLYAFPNPSPARLTAADVLMGHATPYPARLTQAAVLVGHDSVPCVTRWAQCWKITRVDGEVFAFTTLDRDIEFRGVTYKACASLQASAAELFARPGDAGNFEVAGIISDDAITEADLFAGKFDGAQIEAWMVPWVPLN